MLDKEANYVDDIADGDVNIINLSGFTPTDFSSGKKNKHIPGQPKRISFEKNISSGYMNTWCEAHEENDSYGCLLSEGAPLPVGFWINNDGIFKTTPEMPVIYHSVGLQRKKLFTGLLTGVRY